MHKCYFVSSPSQFFSFSDHESFGKNTADSSVFEEISLEEPNFSCNLSTKDNVQRTETKEIEDTVNEPSLPAQSSDVEPSVKTLFTEEIVKKDESFLRSLSMSMICVNIVLLSTTLFSYFLVSLL